MVKNNEITIFDFSLPSKEPLFFLQVTLSKGPMCGLKGCKKKIGATPTCGSNGPIYTQRGWLLCMLQVPKDPRVAYKGVNNEWQ